jgi:predicted transcriptional regulator
MTDNEIIKALDNLRRKILATRFAEQVTESEIMGLVNAISLINRQKAEIERLKMYKSLYDDLKAENLETIKAIKHNKAEAIKEFAERLKEKKCSYSETEHTFDFDGVTVEDIDAIAKEMTEEHYETQ